MDCDCPFRMTPSNCAIFYLYHSLDRLAIVQSQSNTDDSFTMNNSNFLSPYEILPIAKENKYLGIF